MSAVSVFLPIALALLLVEALFAGAEIAIVSANRVKLQSLAREGNRGAVLALRFLEAPEWLMGTILTCHNAAFVANVTLATVVSIDLVGPTYGELLSVLAVIPFLVTFGEIVPKSYCQERADALAPPMARLVWSVRFLVYPAVWLLVRLIRSVLGVHRYAHGPFVTREELEAVVEQASGGDVKAIERKMIERILSFGDVTVESVMVPQVDVSAVNEEEGVEDVIERIEQDGHSRILVYREEIHNIVGFVDARDVLALSPDVTGPLRGIEGLTRPAHFVPESKRADDLLLELQRQKQPLAVVVDEYGGCAGVVTMEDLVEEVVGEISDEYDVEEETLYRKIGADRYLIDARMPVKDVREELNIPIPEGDYETLAGFLLAVFERIPVTGERHVADGWEFIVSRASENRIDHVTCGRLEGDGEDS